MGTNCALCRATTSKRLGDRYGYGVYRCGRCEVCYVDPMPSPDVLDRFYASNYFTGGNDEGGYADYERDKDANIGTFNKYIDVLCSITKGRHLLDYGAATGYFLTLANGCGWDCVGYELSKDATKVAESKGLNMVPDQSALDLISDGEFDVVTLFDVIEHVPTPDVLIGVIKRLVKVGGVVMINTPDTDSLWAKIWRLRWQAVTPPEHVILYNYKSLQYLLEVYGFRIVWRGKIAKRFRLSYITKIAGRVLNSKLIVRISGFVESRDLLNRTISLNLRDNITVCAVREK